MKLLNALKKASLDLYSSLKRFPVTISLSAATAVLLIIKQEMGYNAGLALNEMLTRVIMSVALGIPISLCIKLYNERNEHLRSSIKAAIYIIGAAIAALYYFFLLKDLTMVSVTRYVAISLALYLTFTFIPYFLKKDNFELYVIKLFLRLLITIIYSAVLFGGMSAIIFAINKLLGVYIPEKTYGYVWFLIAGIFASSYFLAGVPSQDQELEVNDYSKVLKILLLYIVMPLISAYTVILYLFFIKSIITRDWPAGLVAHLVIWYSFISTAVIFLIAPLFSLNKWVRSFTFWFTKLIIPALLVMFASIGIRVNAYGITEPRYFLIMAGLWVLGTMIYMNFRKSRRNIVLPVSLAIIAVISVSYPLGAYNMSKFSQNIRLENILSRYDMLKDNNITKPTSEVSETDKAEISQILYYFSKSHSFNDVKYLPADFTFDKMERIFGFSFKQPDFSNIQNRYFSYFTENSGKPIDIKGYDYLFDFRSFGQVMSAKNNDLEVKFNGMNQGAELSVIVSGKNVYNYKFKDLFNKLQIKYPQEKGAPISQEEMTITDENDKVRIKIIIYSVNGEILSGSDSIQIYEMNCNVLVKVK